MKGRDWYQEHDIAEEYEVKRFSGGGRLIDQREKQAVHDAINPVSDRTILEIACGTGRFSVMLADQGADIVGLDISTAMLRQGREKAEALGTQVEFIRGDAERLPFPDDHFDVVLAMRFFHLMPNPSIFLRELRRVAREQIVFDTFNHPSSRSIYNWLLPMGSRLYSDERVRSMLDEAGLEILTADHDFILPYGFYRAIPGVVAEPIYQIDHRISRQGLGEKFASVTYWNARIPE